MGEEDAKWAEVGVVCNMFFNLVFAEVEEVVLRWITSFPNVTSERGDTSFPNVISERVDT